MSSVIFFLIPPDGNRYETSPLFDGEVVFEPESGKADYRAAVQKLKFTDKADFDFLIAYEPDLSAKIDFEVRTLEGGEFRIAYAGFFRFFDAKVDRDKCTITVEPSPNDAYAVLGEGIKKTASLYPGSAVIVKGVRGEYEVDVCTDEGFYYTGGSGNPIGEQEPPYGQPNEDCLSDDPSTWSLLSNDISTVYDGYDPEFGTRINWKRTTTYHREVYTPPDGLSPGPDWTLLCSGCREPGKDTFYRFPPSGLQIFETLDAGRELSTVLETLIAESGAALVVRSEFFSINPDGTYPANREYDFAKANLSRVVVHQKSDVKRPGSADATSKGWNVRLSEFFEDLLVTFNLEYRIEDGILRLEHYSYFESNDVVDIRSERIPRAYDFSGNENVGRETYGFTNGESSPRFDADPIEYDAGEEERNYTVRTFTTDVSYVQAEGNADKVNDAGFVLIATAEIDGFLVAIDGNDVLTWTSLHDALFRSGRAYPTGRLNGEAVAFDSWKPFRKADTFSRDDCAPSTFDPATRYRTSLGVGVVGSARINVFTRRVALELLYF